MGRCSFINWVKSELKTLLNFQEVFKKHKKSQQLPHVRLDFSRYGIRNSC